MKKVTFREIAEFDDEFKKAIDKIVYAGKSVDLDKEVKLGYEPIDVNLGYNHFYISLNQYVFGYRNDDVEEGKLLYVKNKTLEWVVLLCKKFGADYATQGMQAVKDYRRNIKSNYENKILELNAEINKLEEKKENATLVYCENYSLADKVAYYCGLVADGKLVDEK